MVGSRVVIAQHAVHGDQATAYAGVVTVDGKPIAHAVVQPGDLQRAAVGDVAVNSVEGRRAGSAVPLHGIP
ncbi:hypothetical protein D3C76_1407670 [compost metagenome]